MFYTSIIIINKVKKTFTKLKQKSPKEARRALAQLRVESVNGKRAAPRRKDLLVKALVRKKVAKRKTTEDVLEAFVQQDFTDRYEAMNRTPEVALQLWEQARQGLFPPWVPCTSRGAPAVGRLAPERLISSRTNEVSTTTQLPRRRGKKKGTTEGLCGDGWDLLPGSDRVVAEVAQPVVPSLGVAPACAATVVASSCAASAASAAGSGKRRRMPTSFGDGSPFTPVPGVAASAARVPVGLAQSPALAGKTPPPKGRRAALAAAVTPELTTEQMQEMLDELPDMIEDPCEFTQCIIIWKQLAANDLAKTKVYNFYY